MNAEPSIDRQALAQTIQQTYALPVTHLEHLPLGMVGVHYAAVCADGQKYFITLLNQARLAQRSASRLHFTLPLMAELHERGLFPDLVPPLRAPGGALLAYFQGQPLIVYPFVEGNNLMDALPYTPDVLTQLGALAARLHQATAHIRQPIPDVENFQFHFEPVLLAGLQELRSIQPADRPGRVGLQRLLLPHRDELLWLLDALKTLAKEVQALEPPLVICHTDINPANLLRTPAGRLLVVDWEGAKLAPAEHDLFIFTGPGFETCLQSYWKHGGVQKLHGIAFAYYFYRRNLEDLADFMVRILHERQPTEQDLDDLRGIQTDCLDGWPDLVASAARLQAIITNTQPHLE